MVNELARICANAVIPDQILSYVEAVSGLKSIPCGACILHHHSGQGVLAAYPAHDPLDAEAMNQAVEKALAVKGLERLTVLSSQRPQAAPENAAEHTDFYWSVPLPPNPTAAKLRNMLKRASREVKISTSAGKFAWTPEYNSIVDNFCKRKANDLDEGSKYLFHQLDSYLAASPDAMLFSARKSDGVLTAFAIADYSSLATAFYMFAFRMPDAAPGTADLLLQAIIDEGCTRGHSRLNLGLGIDPGVEFFKKKWGAEKFLPYVETSWNINRHPQSWLSRLFGK